MTAIDTKIVERLAFSERLTQALNTVGLSTSITKLQRMFNTTTKGHPVTVHAVRKWLVGESIPTQDKLKELADLAGCDPNWLRFGSSDNSEAWAASRPTREFSEPELLLLHALRRLPDHQKSVVFNLVDGLSKGNTA